MFPGPLHALNGWSHNFTQLRPLVPVDWTLTVNLKSRQNVLSKKVRHELMQSHLGRAQINQYNIYRQLNDYFINKTNCLKIVGFPSSLFPRMHLQYSSSSSLSAPTFSTDPASTAQFSCSSFSPPPVTGPITVSSTSVVTGSYLGPRHIHPQK